jgi:hypothetical protein
MHRGREPARKFEARHRQLHIGVGKFDDGMEQWHRYRADGHILQSLVQPVQHRLIDSLVIFVRDGRVFRALLRGRRRRQAKEIRCAVFACPMQKRCAAENERRPFRARSQQHRQDVEKHVVADDDIGSKPVQRLPQTLILGRDSLDKNALAGDTQPLRPRRDAFEFGDPREDILRIEVRGRRERKKFGSAALDANAEGAARQKSNLVTFGAQNARDRKQRIEMARRGRRDDENFHGIGPLIADKVRPPGPAGRSTEQR